MLAADNVFDPNAAREADPAMSRRVVVVATWFLVPPWFVGSAVVVIVAAGTTAGLRLAT